MTFSSLAFLFVFFPVVFLLYFVCRNNQLRNILLIIASLVFYAYGEPVAVFIMLISVCLNYLFGLLCGEVVEGMAETNTKLFEILRKSGLIAAVILNIGLLFVYKYADFFLNSVGFSGFSLGLTLPIGISFFTFQGLSYVIDVYRDRNCVQRNLLSVMLYISFFPQLIAGPIVKYHDIKDQLSKREFDIDRISRGMQRFIFGLGKKVLVAGPMGLMTDSIFGLEFTRIGIASAWIAAISYSFQIYFDFSGYSDMAIGLGCIFGFDFKENFDKPYSASGIQMFWRKWHISLSTWFKEYVYIPLGGNRKGILRTYINKFIVFLLTGLWHGANWTFVCWGIMHGIGLVLEDAIKKLWNKRKHNISKYVDVLFSITGHIYTCFFVMIAFVIFRADNLSYGVQMILRLFTGSGSNTTALGLLTPTYLIAVIFAVILSTHVTDRIMSKINIWVLRGLSVLVYVISILMLISGGYNPFIYFRF